MSQEEKPKPSGKKLLLGCSVIFLIIIAVIIVIAFATCSGTDPDEAAAKFASQEVTEINVREALDKISGTGVNLGGDITEIEIVSDYTDGVADNCIINVVFHPGTVWDEEDVVSTAVHTSIAAMRVLFSNPHVDTVIVWELGDFTDIYGKTKAETAIRIAMGKYTANRIVDWDVIDDRAWADYSSFFNLAELQYIHPAIRNNL